MGLLRRLAAGVFCVASLTFMVVAILGAIAAASDATPYTCDNQTVRDHLGRTAELWSKGYNPERWQDPTPVKRSEREAIQTHKFCLEHKSDRARVADQRDRYRARFDQYRTRQLVTPFKGPNGTWWAIPAYIVACESGYDYHPNYGLSFGGAYGLLVSTWQQFGGGRWASQANYAEPWQQDVVAHRVWQAVGPSAWACA